MAAYDPRLLAAMMDGAAMNNFTGTLPASGPVNSTPTTGEFHEPVRILTAPALTICGIPTANWASFSRTVERLKRNKLAHDILSEALDA